MPQVAVLGADFAAFKVPARDLGGLTTLQELVRESPLAQLIDGVKLVCPGRPVVDLALYPQAARMPSTIHRTIQPGCESTTESDSEQTTAAMAEPIYSNRLSFVTGSLYIDRVPSAGPTTRKSFPCCISTTGMHARCQGITTR